MERQVLTACRFYRRFNLPPCRLLLIGILAAVLGVSNVAHGATFYLDTANGNDGNPGTADQPWKSLAQVQAGARAGDTIVIQFADASLYAARWPTGFSYRASVLESFTITWTFDTAYPVGQFATGDFWVVGPVRLIGIDPPSVKDATGRVSNGSMLNPPAGSYIPQGFDSAMANNPYDPALNVAFGVSAAHPLEMAAGSSLVSSVSIATPGNLPQLDRAAILTVLEAPAAPGSFRPPYCITDKTIRFNKSALNYSLLQKLAPVAGTPALSTVEAQFAAPWIEHTGGWVARYLRPKQNMPDYGREMHTAIGTAALMLHLNFTNEQKEKLLVEFVQLGIDLYATATHGGERNWVGEGGQAGGRKWPILFAGLMLNDAAMKAIGAKSGDYLYQNGYGPGNIPPDYICFGEDDQTFYVAQLDVDVTHSPDWNPDYRDAQRIPYEAADIGLPEWGIGHVRYPGTSNKWLPTEYRAVAGPPFHGTALAALLTAGGKALWNHNAYFDYTDRYMAFTAPGGEFAGWWRSMSAFTANMWDTYRARCGPIWPAQTGAGGTAPALAPIGDQQTTVGQTLTLTVSAMGGNGPLTYSASGLPTGATFSGQTFTWTPGATQAGTYTVTFTVSDGTAQDSQAITITVTQPNLAPVLATIGDKSVNENQALTFTISATDSNGDAIRYSAANLPSGAGLAGQTFRWTPTFTQAGSYDVTFTADDGQLQTSQTVAITVVNVDRPPVLAAIGNKTVDATRPLSFVLSATDPDGESLTYSADTLPSGAALTGQTFAWTPVSSQTGAYPVTFTVSDGQLTDSETVTITVAGVRNDQIAPLVVQSMPAPDAIQVPLNNLVTLHITDANSGVDANSITIRLDDSIVYQGNVDAYTSASGYCNRSGTKDDYRFIYQPNAMFGFDQTVTVRVNAADLAGNVMEEYQSSFVTEMRAFGGNVSVSPLGGNADSRPATAGDPAGNLWVAWHAGAPGNRDIYVAERPVGASTFQTPVRLTTNNNDQCNPALAVSEAGAVYVAWQDNRNGNWDIYVSICSDGARFSKEVQVTNSTHNEVNPALAIDHQSPSYVYIAWQDDRNGNQDIYAASSTNAFATSIVSQITDNAADQKEPALTVNTNNTAYIFWTDMRNGQADIYAAASNILGWSNVPVVAKPGEQTEPAVAAGAGAALHLLWVDNSDGNKDIYYASLNGLPGSPVAGVSIVDDSSGADQSAPAVVCGPDQRIFACWMDARQTGTTDADTDVYVAELRSGTAGTNILVGDGGTNANQSDPAIGVDRYGEPYVVGTDDRSTTAEIYSAATTLIDPNPLDAKTVVAAIGATIGTDPASISGPEDVSVVVPAGACQADLRMTIWRILNPQVAVSLGSYEFGPSGSHFDQPVTVTIPYTTPTGNRRILPYWYDSVTGSLSQQGITDIQNLYVSSKLSALQFRTTHFTPFYLVEADANGAAVTDTGGASGGCAISSGEEGSPGQLLAPYVAIGAIMIILRRRDRRKRSGTLRSGMKG
jgi:PKD repeat protein